MTTVENKSVSTSVFNNDISVLNSGILSLYACELYCYSDTLYPVRGSCIKLNRL